MLAVFIFVLDLKGAKEFFSEVADHFFDEVGHDFEVAKSLVSLKHSELRVVAARDTFVTKVTVEFEDLGKPADEEAFKVKLWRDAHSERHAEGIVMSLEGLGGSATGHVVKHWGFDFKVVARVEEIAYFGHNLRAHDEEIRAFLVRHEIKVAFAVFCLAVG